MRISDWSSDVCSSDLKQQSRQQPLAYHHGVAVEVIVVPAGNEAREEHRKHRQCIKRERNRDDAERKRQHRDAAFVEKGGEQPTSDERRVWKDGARPCQSRWAPYPYKKKQPKKR